MRSFLTEVTKATALQEEKQDAQNILIQHETE